MQLRWEMKVTTALDRGFSSLAIDLGTAIVVLLFLDEVRRRIKHFEAHAIYINAVLKCGPASSMLFLFMLSLSQLVSCLVLSTPSLYLKAGTVVPSVLLGSTLLCELFLYNGLRDMEIFFKVVFIEMCVIMVALLRRDAKARAEAIGVPITGVSLTIEAYVRKTATTFRAALLGPPLAAFILFWAILFYRFWSHSGADFEIKRTSFTLCISECAFILFMMGHDRSPSAQTMATVTKLSGTIRKKLFGVSMRNGKKKFI
tara:strand:- start:10502 stop:11275 length:774 start_codon:yes stop_codon:yes gene_type:complete